MEILYWASLFAGFVLLADLVRAKYGDWHARRLSIRREHTLTAKYALSPRLRDTDCILPEAT